MSTCKTKTEQHLKWIPWPPLWNYRWIFMRESYHKKLEIFCKDANTVVISMTYLLSSVKNTTRLFGINCKLQFSSYLPMIRTLLGPSQSNSGLLGILTRTIVKTCTISERKEILHVRAWGILKWYSMNVGTPACSLIIADIHCLLLYFEPCPNHIVCIVSISYNSMR